MTATCKTCRFWDKSGELDGEYPEENRLKPCGSPRFFRGYHVKLEEVPDDSALIEDDEGWGMFTGPDFGCIGHEPVIPATQGGKA